MLAGADDGLKQILMIVWGFFCGFMLDVYRSGGIDLLLVLLLDWSVDLLKGGEAVFALLFLDIIISGVLSHIVIIIVMRLYFAITIDTMDIVLFTIILLLFLHGFQILWLLFFILLFSLLGLHHYFNLGV